MTREKAITAATAALWGGPRDIENASAEAKALVKVLEALGVLKFDEPNHLTCPACGAPKQPGNVVCPKCHENDPTLALRTVRGEAPEIRPPWEIDAAVCDVIEKTLYERTGRTRHWPDSSSMTCGRPTSKSSGTRHEHLRRHPRCRARFRA
jgi:hypothetical protein